MFKRICSFLLVLVMVFGLSPMPSRAVEVSETLVTEGDFDLANAIAKAEVDATITLPAGTYTMPSSVANKNITITAAENADVVVEMLNAVTATDSTINFNGVTVKFDNDNYEGLQHAAQVTYTNCKHIGTQFLYAPVVSFTDCTFEMCDTATEYSVWTYGASDVDFTNCIFNTNGKAVLVYTEKAHKADIALSGCTFNSEGTFTGKAAVEVGESADGNKSTYTLTFNNCTVDEDFTANGSTSKLWGNKNSMDGEHLTVTIDNKTVYPAPTYVAKIGEVGYATLDAAIEAVPTNAEQTTVITLSTGTYNLLWKDSTDPNMVNKNITFKGGKDVVFDLTGIVGATWHTQDTGATLTFDGVSVKWNEDNEGYQGFANAEKVVYKDCTIYGTQFMGGDAEFTNCVFEAEETSEHGYAVYGRGAGTLTFTGCTFKTDGRAIMLYQDQTTEINVVLTNCTFTDSGKYTGKNKAVVETGDGDAQTSKFNITINGCTITQGFEKNNSTSNLWGNKDNIPGERLTVTIDGVKVYPATEEPKVEVEIEANGTSQEAIKSAIEEVLKENNNADVEKVEVKLPEAAGADVVTNAIQAVASVNNENVELAIPVAVTPAAGETAQAAATVKLDNTAVETVNNKITQDAQVSLTIQKTAIETQDAVVYEIDLKVNNEEVSNLGGTATVTLPAPEGATFVAVYFYGENDTKTLNGKYLVVNGQVTFETNHFSSWEVAKSVKPTGSIARAIINDHKAEISKGEWVTIYSEATITGTESMVVKLYSGEKLLGTTTLVDAQKVLLNGNNNTVTWHFFLDGTDEWWNTELAVDKLLANEVPDKVELWVDGVNVAQNTVYLSNSNDNMGASSVFYNWGDLKTVMVAQDTAGNYYDTLQDAIDKATTDITLLGNTKINAEDDKPETQFHVDENKNVTIDLGGKTVDGAFYIKSNGTATIKNGSIINTAYVSGIETQGNLTLENMTITSDRHAVRVSGGTTTIVSGTYQTNASSGTAHAINASGNETALDIQGGTFIGAGEANKGAKGNCVMDNGCKTVSISGGIFYGANGVEGPICAATGLAISGGTFTDTGSENWRYSKYMAMGYVAVKNEDGNFEVVKVTNWIQVADTSWYNESDTTFTITTPEQLAGLAKLVNEGKTFSGKTVTLGNDINLSGKDYNENGMAWPGIGVYSESDTTKAFQGTFDGNSKKVENVTFAAQKYTGLFNQLSGATVKNLTVEVDGFVTDATGSYGGAAIAGYAWGSTIDTCVSEGTINGTHNIAGIVVRIRDAKITGCTNKATLTTSYTKVGGIVAISQNNETGSVIQNCTNSGNITSTDNTSYTEAGANSAAGGVGGIIGCSCYGSGAGGNHDGPITITGCTNTGTLTATNKKDKYTPVGQIAGQLWTSNNTVSGNKGTTATVAEDHYYGTADGLGYATVENNVATYISSSALEAGGNYLVTGPDAKPVIELKSGETISFNTSLAGIDGTGITAESALKVTSTTNENVTTFTAETAVAAIGEVKYTSLQNAIDAAKAGETITLLADVALTDGLEIAADDKLTIDLAGYTVSYASTETTGNAAITNRGDLTITDSGVVTIAEGEESTGGKITYSTTAPSTTAAYATNTITNYGTLTVKGGTIENTTNSSCCLAIDNNSTNGNANLTINNGTVTAAWRTIRQYANSSANENNVTINDGTVKSESNRVVWVHIPTTTSDAENAPKAALTVTGGTLTTSGLSAVSVWTAGDSFAGTKIELTGGTFQGQITLNDGSATDSATVNITGGTYTKGTGSYDGGIVSKSASNDVKEKVNVSGGSFDTAPADDLLADGFEVKKDENGNITVVEKPATPTAELIDNGVDLSLVAEIRINQYVAFDLENYDQEYIEANGGLLVWTNAVEEDKAVYAEAAEVIEGLTRGKDYNEKPEYWVQTKGIAAKKYADVFYFRAYLKLKDGSYIYSPLKQYSVQAYGEAVLKAEDATDKLKKVCKEMLEYGASAQELFEYNTDHLANANIGNIG